LALPFVAALIPIGLVFFSPLVATMDISGWGDPLAQVFFLACRNAIWLVAWGILIHSIHTQEGLLQQMTTDWHHVFLMVVPVVGFVVYSFTLVYQCCIGRFSGWYDTGRVILTDLCPSLRTS
jgi:hypothetical protein